MKLKVISVVRRVICLHTWNLELRPIKKKGKTMTKTNRKSK
jgi:hypothetical protein